MFVKEIPRRIYFFFPPNKAPRDFNPFDLNRGNSPDQLMIAWRLGCHYRRVLDVFYVRNKSKRNNT